MQIQFKSFYPFYLPSDKIIICVCAASRADALFANNFPSSSLGHSDDPVHAGRCSPPLHTDFPGFLNTSEGFPLLKKHTQRVAACYVQRKRPLSFTQLIQKHKVHTQDWLCDCMCVCYSQELSADGLAFIWTTHPHTHSLTRTLISLPQRSQSWLPVIAHNSLSLPTYRKGECVCQKKRTVDKQTKGQLICSPFALYSCCKLFFTFTLFEVMESFLRPPHTGGPQWLWVETNNL